MTDQPVEVHELAANYGSHDVFRDVTLSAPESSVYALLGRNGEGKTTLVLDTHGSLIEFSSDGSKRRRWLEGPLQLDYRRWPHAEEWQAIRLLRSWWPD